MQKEKKKERKESPHPGSPKRQSTLGSNNVATSHLTKTWTLRPHGCPGNHKETTLLSNNKKKKGKERDVEVLPKVKCSLIMGRFAGFLHPRLAFNFALLRPAFVFVRTPRLAPKAGDCYALSGLWECPGLAHTPLNTKRRVPTLFLRGEQMPSEVERMSPYCNSLNESPSLALHAPLFKCLLGHAHSAAPVAHALTLYTLYLYPTQAAVPGRLATKQGQRRACIVAAVVVARTPFASSSFRLHASTERHHGFSFSFQVSLWYVERVKCLANVVIWRAWSFLWCRTHGRAHVTAKHISRRCLVPSPPPPHKHRKKGYPHIKHRRSMKFFTAALLGVASTQAFLVARPSPVVSPPSSLSKCGATTLHDSDAFLPRSPPFRAPQSSPPFRAPRSTRHPGQDVDTLQGRLFATDTRRVILFDGGMFL